MDFRRLTPTEREGSTPVRRPRAVIVTDDGLGFAVAECDVVDGHSRIPSLESGAFGRFSCPQVPVRAVTSVMNVRSARAWEVTQMPRTAVSIRAPSPKV